ncbi:hypothetical protein ACH5RR_006609 [Cinchona calisaya]|uniref:Reticulon-like protein n=1 Tax=Cinchona calisaya TaxID=153742 RepID=A0ABD3APT6_9GENT
MDVGRRKGAASSRTGGVVAGSVWESRMKLDEVKGGIKVFNGEENSNNNNNSEENDENNGIVAVVQVDKKVNLMRPKLSPPPPVGANGKRKTWKSESSEGSPIQIARQRSETSKNLEEQCKELSMSADGIKKSPTIQNKKKRSEAVKDLSASFDGTERGPIQSMKTRSLSQKVSSESSDGNEKNSAPLRKLKSESIKALTDNATANEKNSELRKVKSESTKVLDESSDGNGKNSLQLVIAKSEVSSKEFDDTGNGIKGQPQKEKVVEESNNRPNENSMVGIKKTRSDENCKDFDVCEEKVITSNFSNVGQAKSPPKAEETDDFDDADGDEEDWDDEELSDEEIEVEIEKKSLVVKEITIQEQKPKKVVVEEKKFKNSNERPVSIPSIVMKQSPPIVSHARIHPIPAKTRPIPDEFHGIPRTHGKLQSFVDLVMWRDVSKSAFVFGIGTFGIISSSYTKDLNISLISVLSYLGLVYLAAIFLFRSFISRGDLDDSSLGYVVGEEEAVWLVKMILPYLNEFLLKIKALFSGDPATTMKMAVLLFVLARCGSSITIWKMAKLGFFGVFTVPKVCSSYSTQLTAYGTFWIRRFRDAWESCSHKKAVAFAIFTIVWNLSSIVARIWAVFMLFVAFRYYQPSFMREGWATSDDQQTRVEDSAQSVQMGAHTQRQRRRPVLTETGKHKKPF